MRRDFRHREWVGGSAFFVATERMAVSPDGAIKQSTDPLASWLVIFIDPVRFSRRSVYRQFESVLSRQSHPVRNSLRRPGSRKNPLFQKGLAERPGTALPARRPISFSFPPVSLEDGDCANLVPMLDFVDFQWLDGWHGPAEFESASGWRRELGSE